ncbi:hypothetical protein [Flavobacterium sp.]|uniref:hypothetical protein n=1 Tax=Flavobacterium sp. TaxID=239 RepID=UPI0037C167B5
MRLCDRIFFTTAVVTFYIQKDKEVRYMQIILENLYKAYFEARKNKRNTIEQLKFEVNYEMYLQELYEQLLTRSYKVQPCKAFVIEKPVYREVFTSGNVQLLIPLFHLL